MTFPGGTHDLWIRYWLAAGGIDPDKDIETIVVPPPQMVANMKVGTMDAFCVGEPWNDAAGQPEASATPRSPPASSGRTTRRSPSRMRAAWVDKYPKAAKALLMAVMEAQQWCDKAGEPRRGAPRSCAKRAMDQRARSPTSPTASRATFDYGTAASSRTARM